MMALLLETVELFYVLLNYFLMRKISERFLVFYLLILAQESVQTFTRLKQEMAKCKNPYLYEEYPNLDLF